MGILNKIFTNSKYLAKREFLNKYSENIDVKVTIDDKILYTTYARLCYVLIDYITSDITFQPVTSYEILNNIADAIKPGVDEFVKEHVYEINTGTLTSRYFIDLNELGIIGSENEAWVLYQAFKTAEFMEDILNRIFKQL